MTQVGSFYAFQVLGNIIVLATNSGYICTASSTVYSSLVLLYMGALFGISILGTNLLCHRYLLEKAKVMSRM
jgi:hypothetical protein